jgi:hypothetical protein
MEKHDVAQAMHQVAVAYLMHPEWHAVADVAQRLAVESVKVIYPRTEQLEPQAEELILLHVMLGMLTLLNAPAELVSRINAQGPMGRSLVFPEEG